MLNFDKEKKQKLKQLIYGLDKNDTDDTKIYSTIQHDTSRTKDRSSMSMLNVDNSNFRSYSKFISCNSSERKTTLKVSCKSEDSSVQFIKKNGSTFSRPTITLPDIVPSQNKLKLTQKLDGSLPKFGVKQNSTMLPTFSSLNKEKEIILKNTPFSKNNLHHRNKQIALYNPRLVKNKIHDSEFLEKTKLIQFNTGVKYLLKNEESVFSKQNKIKQLITMKTIHRNDYPIEQQETDLESLNDHYNKTINYIRRKGRHDTISYFKKHFQFYFKKLKGISIKKYGKCRRFDHVDGMNELRRINFLSNQDAFLYINGIYGEKDITEQKEVLLNIFNKNIEKVPKILKMNNVSNEL